MLAISKAAEYKYRTRTTSSYISQCFQYLLSSAHFATHYFLDPLGSHGPPIGNPWTSPTTVSFRPTINKRTTGMAGGEIDKY